MADRRRDKKRRDSSSSSDSSGSNDSNAALTQDLDAFLHSRGITGSRRDETVNAPAPREASPLPPDRTNKKGIIPLPTSNANRQRNSPMNDPLPPSTTHL